MSDLRNGLGRVRWMGVLVWLLSAGVAQADLPSERDAAVQELDAGNTLYGQGRWQAALEHYQRAYAHVPSPKLFFNYGQVYRKLGRLIEAAEAYERFLAEATDAAPSHRTVAERTLRELARSLAGLDVQASFGRTVLDQVHVWVDGADRGMVTAARTVWVLPGGHHVLVRDGSNHVEVDVTVESGRLATVVAHWEASSTPPPLPATAASQPHELARAAPLPSARQPLDSPRPFLTRADALAPSRTVTATHPARTWAWATLGIGAVSLATSGAFVLAATVQSKEGDPRCDEAGCFDDGYQAKARARDFADVATGFFVAGSALMASSVTLFLLAPSRSEQARPKVAWGISPTGLFMHAKF